MGKKIGFLFKRLLQQRNLTSKAMSEIKTFVFLDLETTGLPHMEHNLTKITEMCVVAVQADHIELGCFPRVHNKLTFCFNPKKAIHPQSSDITGLSNELLEHQVPFSSDVVEVFNKWIAMNKTPICFVAHNGNRFDYPILRAEIDKSGAALPEDIICVDSLIAFRTLDQQEFEKKESEELQKKPKEVPFEFCDGYDELLSQVSEEYEQSLKHSKILSPEEVQVINETTPKKQIIMSQSQPAIPKRAPVGNKFSQKRCSLSYKLQDVYKRLTSKEPVITHEAESDVVMLITCAAVFGEKFVDYANKNAIKLSEIPAMKPGKRIGI